MPSCYECSQCPLHVVLTTAVRDLVDGSISYGVQGLEVVPGDNRVGVGSGIRGRTIGSPILSDKRGCQAVVLLTQLGGVKPAAVLVVGPGAVAKIEYCGAKRNRTRAC